MSETIVLTGGSGAVATTLRQALAASAAEVGLERRVVLVDLVPPPRSAPLLDHESFVEASIDDEAALVAVFAGARIVVHLAGYPSERPWSEMLTVNIDGTRSVLEAALRSGVRRVLLASSIHAVGLHTIGEGRDVVELVPRPDTFYGVSKVAMEALGTVYGERAGLAVVSARIGTAVPEPIDVRSLSTWLSPADLGRLVEAAAALEEPGHRIVWAISANARRVVSLEAGTAMGYVPIDDAERFADRFEVAPPLPPETVYGGEFADEDHPLGVAW